MNGSKSHRLAGISLPRIITPLVIILAIGCATSAPAKDITVATDGSGNFKTLQEAIASIPANVTERTVLHIKPGIYHGQILLPKDKSNVTFLGTDATKTVITYDHNVQEPDPSGIGDHYKGYGVVIQGADFRAEKITFENTSGDHGQAIALRIEGDRAILRDCRMLGWQDTLLVHSNRQYFADCYIEGRVDFIYGAATAVFEKCIIHSKNGGYITAASTLQDNPFGFVFFNCKLTGDPTPWNDPSGKTTRSAKPQTFLGRPWRPYASVAYINCEMGGHILPAAWDNWRNAQNESTARYAEYHSTGPGANAAQRVTWSKQLTEDEAKKITVESVLAGRDHWNPRAPQP